MPAPSLTLPQTLPVRLNPGDDLRCALEAAVAAHGATAAFVLAGIGSLGPAVVRWAGATEAVALAGDVEILTLSGTVAANGSHLHAALADAQGAVCGGHVAYGCTVRTTAEVLLAVLPGWHFRRAHDPVTGYDELVVRAPDPSRHPPPAPG